MAAVQGKVTAFLGLTKESLDGASDSLDGDREIKRRLMSAQHYDKAVVNCFCKTTASARLWLYIDKRLYFKYYSLLHFAVRQLLCWAFLYGIRPSAAGLVMFLQILFFIKSLAGHGRVRLVQIKLLFVS